MREIFTATEIAAPAETVWAIVTDFAAYPEWNPFLRSMTGDARAGARLEVTMVGPGGREVTFRPLITKLEPGHELRWLGSVLVRGIFDGEHSLAIEPLTEGQVRLVHREIFRGLLVAPVLRWLGASTERGFIAMNRALKRRAEERARASR